MPSFQLTPGSLEDEVVFPEDCIKTLRARPFRFAARSCNKWSDGRVIICGDAAHVFPPCKSIICIAF
jgi:2-polyprenyl-6-methoxyphenol hydroxylase-like FAD-dependent oxidoreductase